MSKTTYPAPDGHFIGVHIRKCTVMPGKKECLINGLLVHYVSSTTLKSTTITQVKAILKKEKKQITCIYMLWSISGELFTCTYPFNI